MTTHITSNGTRTESHQPGTWSEAILAAFPPLLMVTLYALGRFMIFDVYDMNQQLSVILGIGLMILVVAVLFIAWRQGFPLWSASWYLHGAWVIMAVLSLSIDSLNLEDSWRYTNFLFLAWIALCIVGYFVIVIKSKMHGLLSVSFLFPVLGLMFLEFVPNPIEGWLAIGIGFLIAFVVAVIVRSGSPTRGFWLVLGANLIVGLALAYVSEYMVLLPSFRPPYVPKFENFLRILGFYSIFGLGVVALPFVLRGMWDLGRRKLVG